MTHSEALKILQQVGERLDAVLEHNAAALPEPEHDEAEVFRVLFPADGSGSEVLKALTLLTLRMEPLLSFFEINIAPIVASTKVEDLAQFKKRKGKHAA
jgi:hypothetical protein